MLKVSPGKEEEEEEEKKKHSFSKKQNFMKEGKREDSFW
jgi:hypothetical protein